MHIVEAPDAATIARVSIALGARGSVHTQSFEAIGVQQFLEILAS